MSDQIHNKLAPMTEDPKPTDYWKLTSTTATVIGALVGIASAIDTSKKLKEINKQLIQIVALQVKILEEIRMLKVYFDEALYNAFLNETAADIIAQTDRFDIIIAGIDNINNVKSNDDERLRDLLNDVEQAAFKSLVYGPAAYQSASMAMILLKSLYSILKVEKRSQARAFNKFYESFDKWIIDPSVGILSTINKVSIEMDNVKNQFDAVMQEEYSERDVHPHIIRRSTTDHVLYKRHYKLLGDLNSNIILQTRNDTHDGSWRNVIKEQHKSFDKANALKSYYWQLFDRLNKLKELRNNVETVKDFSSKLI